MSVNRIYESSGSGSWLREADLNGKSHKVEILEVDLVGVKGDDNTIHDKIELKFNGKEKSLLLNKTNAKTIASGLGDDEKSWIGCTIIMYPTTCEFQGSTVPCIRVRLDEVMADEDSPF
jgi:hypothetical protein|tara:strand:+ start:4148 stop:4504 length:357 start_codon:yes stop_codon:yes gene_type:complete